MGNAPLAFHLLANPTGAVCNLDCKYCFFLSKELLYPGSRFRMTDELLETYIRQLLEAQQSPDVNVAWQGGEPTLMSLDFFKRSIELVEKYKKSGQQILHTIQTNSTKIDDAWATCFGADDMPTRSWICWPLKKCKRSSRLSPQRNRTTRAPAAVAKNSASVMASSSLSHQGKTMRLHFINC